MIEITYTLEIKSAEDFRKFVQRGVYEPFLLDLLNRFHTFHHDFAMIDEQYCGQCDYIEKSSGEMFEATLVISSEVVKKIFIEPGYYSHPCFSRWIYLDGKKNLVESLERKEKKKNLFLFNIFPMRNPRPFGGVHSYIASDGWDIIINELISERRDLLENKKVFLISYNPNDKFLLKQLYPDIFLNEFIEFYDEKDVFPLRVKNVALGDSSSNSNTSNDNGK